MKNARRLAVVRSTVALAAVGLVSTALLVRSRHDTAPVEPASAASVPERIELELHGCESFGPDGTCHLDRSGTLSLWARAPVDRSLELWLDGARVEPTEPVQGGQRYALRPSVEAHTIELRATRDGAEVVVRTLLLAPPQRPGWYHEAEAARIAADFDRAAQILEPHLASGPDHHRGWAHYAYGRVELRRSRPSEARAHWREASELLARSGWTIDAAMPLGALAYVAIIHGHVDEGTRALARNEELIGQDIVDRAMLETLLGARAMLADVRGDQRDALHLDAVRVAMLERHGDSAARVPRLGSIASTLAEMGRSAESEAMLREALAGLSRTQLAPTDRSAVLTSLGWSLFLRREGGEAADDPTPMFEEALRINRDEVPTLGPHELVNNVVNVALAHALAGRAGPGREAADEARRRLEGDQTDHWLAYWVEYADAAVALLEKDYERALALYERMARAGAVLGSDAAVWRAHVGRAEVLHARGDTDAAIDALLETERELDEVTIRAPFDDGRESFVALRERGTRLLLELLVDAGRVDDAAAVARAARTRVLRSVVYGARAAHLDGEARQRWDERVAGYRAARARHAELGARNWEVALSGYARFAVELDAARDDARRALESALATVDALQPFEPRAIADGELAILLFPATESWVAFAIDAEGVRAHHVEPREARDATEIATALLAAMLPHVRHARRVLLMPHGALRELDLHALPLGDVALVDLVDVSYALDLARPARMREAPARAWIVADPRGDLPAARREADAVRVSLSESGWSVGALRGGEVTRDALERALAGASLVHFAGHGRFDPELPWESALMLADEATLTAGDIVALERVPEQVVLSSCDATRTRGGATPESISLATAFVLAGSAQVIGATRPVDDAALAALMSELHRGQGELAARLRRAVLAVRDHAPGLDWRALRVVEP